MTMPETRTLRDEFAMAALTGMLAYSYVNQNHGNFHENCTIAQAADVAYWYAEAMLFTRQHQNTSHDAAYAKTALSHVNIEIVQAAKALMDAWRNKTPLAWQPDNNHTLLDALEIALAKLTEAKRTA